jgi:hypothetical protein
MPHELDRGIFYVPPGTPHYNIRLKTGLLLSRSTERAFQGLAMAEIDWVWIVDEKRRATADEIRRLCGGKT